MKRSPVLSAYREAGFIDTFPLHDDETLRQCYAGKRLLPIEFSIGWMHNCFFNHLKLFSKAFNLKVKGFKNDRMSK